MILKETFNQIVSGDLQAIDYDRIISEFREDKNPSSREMLVVGLNTLGGGYVISELRSLGGGTKYSLKLLREIQKNISDQIDASFQNGELSKAITLDDDRVPKDVFEKIYSLAISLFHLKTFLDYLKAVETDHDSDSSTFNQRIFYSEKSQELFHEFIVNSDSKDQLREVSFIFRKMQEDKLIYREVTQSEMYRWVNEAYDFDLDRLLTLKVSSSRNRANRYSDLKKLLM